MDNQELTNSEMEKIERHLKAEAKIQEVHSVIDDLLEEDIASGKEGKAFYRKAIALLLLLGFAAFLFWYWSNWNASAQSPEIKESTPPIIEKNDLQESAPEIKKLDSNQEPTEATPKQKLDEDQKVPAEKIKQAPPIATKPKEEKTGSQKASQSRERMIAANFSPIEWKESKVRSNTKQVSIALKKPAIEKYKAGNYSEALSLLVPLSKEYPQDWELLFFKGFCQLQKSPPRLEEAIQTFDLIIDNDDNDYLEEANWFLVNALVLKGEEAKALTVLKNNFLLYPNSAYYAKAKKVEGLLK